MSLSCLILELAGRFWTVVLSTVLHSTKHLCKVFLNYHLLMRTVSVPYTLIDDEAFDLQKDLYTVQ